jgi:SPP1 family phage portal protein
MFTLSKNTELTKELLQKILNRFMTTELPKLQLWGNYYRGKHAILNKSYSDASKECNHIITNYCKIITDTYGGYICGKPVSYSSNEDITDIQDTLNYNDSAAQDMSMITNALIYGVAYELQWIDKYSQVRYSQINPLNCFAIFDNTLDCELLYFVRWYKLNAIDDNDKTYATEVYDKNTIRHYTSPELGGALTEVDTEPHYFGDVPVTVFYLNENEENIFNSVITLNDAYNELQSSEIDDFNAWVDAYLTFTGVDAETDDINAMKENRVLVLPEGAEANWLTKNANDTQIVNILENIKKNIFKVTACPDMADETFLAQSGTALAYKLVGFENVASGIVARFTKALQRRIELICNVLNLKASDATWRDIRINFVRNLPVNLTETINLVNNLKGTVSDATLLAQLPFIKDVGAELEAVKKQNQEQLSVYSFGANDYTD